MKKRLLSVFLSLCMMLTMVPAAFAAELPETGAPAAQTQEEPQEQPQEQPQGNIQGDENQPSADVQEEENAVGEESTGESTEETDSQTPAGTQADPFTTVAQYNAAVANNSKDGQDVYLTVEGQAFTTENTFALTNVQSRSNPPKLHLTIKNCTFTGNTANDNSNSSFMYLPNCQSLVLENCTFNSGSSELKYGINWNLCGITDSTVKISGCTFNGNYSKNALKLNQRNGSDDKATDVKPSSGTATAATIQSAIIEDCTFASGAKVQLGSQGKGESGAAASSTGAFPVTIQNCKSSVVVELAYKAASSATIDTVTLEAGKTLTKEANADPVVSEPVAKIGNVEYTTLQAAIAAAQQNNGTVTMLKDVTLSATQEITGALTIDLNGHKISNGSIANNGYMLKINYGAKLNLVGEVENSAITDSRNNTTGTITAICVLGELNVKGNNLTISRGNGIAIKVDESGADKQGKLTVESGTITADQAVQNWGISTISGGTFNGDVDSAAYSNIGGQLTITGGSFTNDVYTWQMKYPEVWPSAASKINISGGTFRGDIAELYGNATTSLQPVENVDFPDDGSCPEGVVSISGGTFSKDVSDFVAPGYQCTGSDSQWTISAANNMGADVNVSGGDSNKTASATIGGNYAGNEGSDSGEAGSTGGSVTAGPTVEINVQTGTSDGATSANESVSKTEITVDSAALNSIKNNSDVQAVEITTDVGTLTIDKAAWSSMTDAATSGGETASLVLTLEDKSTSSSENNKTYEVTATVAGSEDTNAFDEGSAGSVIIAVPYTLGESNSGVNVYWTDDGKMVDMNATLEEGVLSWETSHFSTYQAVAYSGSDEAQYMSGGNATSGTLSNAISAGGSITLLKDVTVSSSTLDITGSKDVTLDLNGHTITGSQVRVFWVKSGTLTLTGEGTVTASGENTESFTSASSVIRVGDNSTPATPKTEAKLYVGADVTIEAPATYGVSVFGSGTKETVEISGKIHATGKAAALSGNGMAQYSGTTITIKPGAEITATQDAAIYHPQNGTLTIEGGTISGLTGIELKAGTVSVTGDAVIKGNGSLEHSSSGDGTSTKGYGIAIVENTAYAGKPTVTLSNGSVEGDVAVLSDANYGSTSSENGKVEINGAAVVNGNVTNDGFGESNITGGTVKGNVTQSGSGKTTISGAAVVEGNVNTTSGQTTISGGKVTGDVTSSGGSTSIEGGDFGGNVPSGSVSSGKVVVTFDPNGGTCTEKTRVLAGNNAAIGDLPTPTRSGYQFNGWYNGNTKVETTTTFSANATLVANWSYISTGGGGSSGGGGGGSSSASYAITVDKATGGTVKVSPTRADKGDTVTITVNPNSGYELDTLTVTNKDGGRISVNNAGNNKYTFTMPSGKVTVKATFAKVSEQPQPGISFSDVSASAYYYDAVKWAVENDVTSGTSATTFSPDASCTRAQMVTFLWRANGSPRAAGANPFTDVQAGAYYYDAVLWAVEKGITSGTSATTFSPDMTVTRGQTVTFLHRANGSPAASGSNPFTDVAADAYYTAAVQWAVAEGVTSGTGANTFSPDAPCTRAQIVTFLYRDMA